jgi:uncharacterized protein YndB with AHSA1/START domain
MSEKEVTCEISIDADAATVWKALTDGAELKRWFPLDARVTPGEGGAVWLSWGEGADWEAPITIWEPNRHLRTIDPPPSKLALDYFIESRGGETVLRLVHSGFAADAWDDEIETMTAGWRAFQANLKLYLERHRGTPRTMAYFRHPVVELPRQDAFPRLMTALGLDGQELREGGRFAISAPDDVRLEGVVQVLAPPGNLSGRVENLDDAFLMIELEPGRGKCRPAFWLSLYGDAGKKAPDLTKSLEKLWKYTFTQHS